MRPLFVLLLVLVVTSVSLAPGAHAEGDDPAWAVAEALVERMIAAERGVKDAVYTLHRREWADGGLIPEERMAIKWRRGGDVYMRWVGERYNGREVLYSPTLTGGKLLVSTAAYVPTLTLDPKGSVAMRGNRHSVLDAGLSFPVRMVREDFELARSRPELPLTAEDLGPRVLFGESARCARVTMPKDQEPGFYAMKSEFCIADRTGLPVFFEITDRMGGQVQVVERFNFVGVKVNQGLTDADFSAENPAYNL